MRKLLLGLGLALATVVVLPGPARATVCTIPNTISNGALVDATPVQQNFNALVSCANNIDWQNIDSSGIYASQIIPINPNTATFGSGQDYTFSNHLIVLDGIVVDSTAVPTSGIAGGNTNEGFRFWSNAGAGADTSFRFVTSTAVPSSQPVLAVDAPGGSYTYFEISSQGDGTFAGGVSFDGTQPDGSSLIGGGTSPKGSPIPFWLISQAGSGAKSNFAFLDSDDKLPAIVVENSSAKVIFTVDGIGDTQAAGGISSDNATPPAVGYAGGGGNVPMSFSSNANAGASQFVFINTTNAPVVTVDKAGGISIGASGQTDIEPTSANFGGKVTMPTISPNSAVCTNSNSDLVSGLCGISVYHGNNSPVVSPIIEYGSTVVSISGSAGPNAGTSGSTTVSLPVSMSDTNYNVQTSADTNWVFLTVTSKTTGGFNVNVGNAFPPGNQDVTVSWLAVGH